MSQISKGEIMFERNLRDFMIKDLKDGIPTFKIEEFAEKAGYSFEEFKEKSKEINISKIWDVSIEEAQKQLKTELSNIETTLSQIDNELKSAKMNIPFLFKEKKQQLAAEQESLSLEKNEKKFSLKNSRNYYDDFKKKLDRFHRQNQIHVKTQDKRYKEIESKLSVEHGVNLKQTDKSQYIIALDNRQGYPVAMEIPPIKEGQEPRVKIDGKDVGKLIQVMDSNYTILRQAPEVNRIYQALEKEADRSASSKVFAGIVDFSNRIVSSRQFDMNQKNDPDKRRFVELAVTNFHKCVLLTKDEFERSRIVGEEVSISKDRSDLGRAPQVEKELER
jgi:hypothetical protein